MKRIYFLSDVSAIRHNGANVSKLMVNGTTAWLGGGVYYAYTGPTINTGSAGRTSSQITYAVSQKPDANNLFIIQSNASFSITAATGFGAEHSMSTSSSFYAGGRHIGDHSHGGLSVSDGGAQSGSGTVTNTWDAFGVNLTHSISHLDYTNPDNRGCSCSASFSYVLFP